jgi:ribonuclease Z
VTFEPREFDKDGVVYEKSGVKVTAFEVDHGDAIKPAYGYRVDYNGHSVLISGDTHMTENVVKYGSGVDLLVHEVCAARPEITDAQGQGGDGASHLASGSWHRLRSSTAENGGVYSYRADFKAQRAPASIDDVISQTRQTYDGPLVAGQDLMSFEIGNQGGCRFQAGPLRVL